MRLLFLSLACLLAQTGFAACEVEFDLHEPWVAWVELQHPDCESELESATQALEEELAKGPVPLQGESAEKAKQRYLKTQALTGMYRLRRHLRSRDLVAAQELHRQLDLLAPHWNEGGNREFKQQWAALSAAFLGAPTPPDTLHQIGEQPDWLPIQEFCGTPLIEYLISTRSLPDMADFWVARGRHDLAIADLLQREWLVALDFGIAPPELRYFVEQMLGPGSYDREVELALDGLRITKAPSGTIASLPFLGRTLPVPLGYRIAQCIPSENGGCAKTRFEFETPGELAEYLRPILLGRPAL